MEEEEMCNNNILSGTVESLTWTFQDGLASIFGDEMNIDLFSNQETYTNGTVCDRVTRISPWVFGRYKAEVGRIELSNPFSGDPDAKTITIFDPATNINIIIGGGYIEFTEVSETVVKGVMDISNGEDELCGPFELKICR